MGEITCPGPRWRVLCLVLALALLVVPAAGQAKDLNLRSGIRVELKNLPEFRLPPDPKPVPEHAPENVLLDAGQAAPFDGILVSEEWMRWHLDLEVQRDQLKVQAEAVIFLTSRLQAQCLDGLEETAEQARTPWWESPSLNRWGGFILGVAVTIGVIFVADEINDYVDRS